MRPKPLPTHRIRKKRLPRKGSALSRVDVEIYNNRQTMRCVGTRPHWLGNQMRPDAEISSAIYLPSYVRAAFQAIEQPTEQALQELFNTLVELINEQIGEKAMRYYRNPEHPQVECLARLLIDEFMYPARYRKTGSGHSMSISALALAMRMDRGTFKRQWFNLFLTIRETLRGWHAQGKECV